MWITMLDEILLRIDLGEYNSLTKLPSENELVNLFKATRYEVRKTYETLEEMGYVDVVKGKGRYLKTKKEKIELLLSGDISFTEKMRSLGHQMESINIGFSELKRHQSIRDELKLAESDRLFQISRLRIIDGEPAAIHTSYISNRVFPNIEKDGLTLKSMFAYYNTLGYSKFAYHQSNLQALIPSKKERELLKCSSLVPVIMLDSQCLDAITQTVLEVTKIVYRGDRFICRISSEDQKPV